MTQYEIYTFVLCLVVFVLITAFSGFLIATITKQGVRLIKHGADDDKITTEYYKSLKKKKSKFDWFFSLIVCIIMVAIFSFSMFVGCSDDVYSSDVPTFRVVNTGSMEEKHKKNEYLVENNLNDQIATFDLIIVYKAPKEEDLKLYDIVVYEVDGIMIVHRIIEIEEPNQYHPNERWFRLQGDAVESPDRFPVKYEQIKGIYKGDRVPFVGSFVLFMQSPAGWLCILLVVGAMIVTPLLEKALNKAKYNRLVAIGVIELPVEEIIVPEEQTSEEITEEVVEEILTEESVSEVAITEDSPTETASEVTEEKAGSTLTELLANLPNNCIEYFSVAKTKLERIKNVKFTGTKTRTYKHNNTLLARFEVRGKALYLYLALDPENYQNSEYLFTDVSHVKKYQSYAMRLKITTKRRLSEALDLIDDLVEKKNLTFTERGEL